MNDEKDRIREEYKKARDEMSLARTELYHVIDQAYEFPSDAYQKLKDYIGEKGVEFTIAELERKPEILGKRRAHPLTKSRWEYGGAGLQADAKVALKDMAPTLVKYRDAEKRLDVVERALSGDIGPRGPSKELGRSRGR